MHCTQRTSWDLKLRTHVKCLFVKRGAKRSTHLFTFFLKSAKLLVQLRKQNTLLLCNRVSHQRCLLPDFLKNILTQLNFPGWTLKLMNKSCSRSLETNLILVIEWDICSVFLPPLLLGRSNEWAIVNFLLQQCDGC